MLLLLPFVQCRPEWEIRHGSLLGIKYLVAVRQVHICFLPFIFDTSVSLYWHCCVIFYHVQSIRYYVQ